MQTRDFMVDGSYPLKKALLEELALEGMTFQGKVEDYQYAFIAPVMANDSVTDIYARNNENSVFYSLPEDYAIAKEAFLSVKDDKVVYNALIRFQVELTKLVEEQDLEGVTGIPVEVMTRRMIEAVLSE
jgi:hypothetical protein